MLLFPLIQYLSFFHTWQPHSLPSKDRKDNRSSPDIYDELLPKSFDDKTSKANEDTYIQNIKRIHDHHQVIMIFVIGGITHSEIKYVEIKSIILGIYDMLNYVVNI